MQEVNRALEEVRSLYQKVLGRPAPEIAPGSFVAFPPGVDPVGHAVKEVELLKQISEQLPYPATMQAWVPPADSYVTPDAYVIRAEIPGVERETLRVVLAAGECIVSGERKAPEFGETLRPINVERPFGPFQRRFALPPGSDPQHVTAHYREGVLEVRVTVEENAMPKGLKVEVA